MNMAPIGSSIGNTATFTNTKSMTASRQTLSRHDNCDATATAAEHENVATGHDAMLMRSHHQHAMLNNNEGSFSDSEIGEYLSNEDNEDDWNSHHEYGAPPNDSAEQRMMDEMAQTPDTIINNKSSKEIYKAMAKEWGVTCKMSEHCRCMECQSGYFDCAYEENEHNKSDGGLAAGTPLFLSEILHGSPCNIL